LDLNFLYSEHQQSLMRAMASTSCNLRTRHLAFAGSVARRIQAWQHTIGANAANGWTLVMDEAGTLNHSEKRITV